MRNRFVSAWARDRPRCRRRGRGPRPRPERHHGAARKGPRRSRRLAQLRRRLRQPAPQSAHADHAGQCRPAGAPVGVPDRAARQVRGDADRARRRDLHHRAEQLRLGDRRAHRPSDLALRARPARGHGHLLRPGQPRLRRARQPAVHEHARRAPGGLRHEDRRGGLGRRSSTTTRKATAPPRRRSSSRTRSWSASPAPNTASAASSTPSTPPPASAPGASGWCPVRARRAARAGKATRGSAAAAPRG